MGGNEVFNGPIAQAAREIQAGVRPSPGEFIGFILH